MKLKNKGSVRGTVVSLIAALCIYLVVMLPIGFAQTTSGFVRVDIKSPDGTKTLATANLPTFESLVSKTISSDTQAGEIVITIDITNRQHTIKKGYVWLCQGETLDKCVRKEPKYTFEKYFSEKGKPWKEVADLSAGSAKFPQSGTILTVVQLDVGGQDIWVGSFDTITRTSSGMVSNFPVDSFDVSSVEVLFILPACNEQYLPG